MSNENTPVVSPVVPVVSNKDKKKAAKQSRKTVSTTGWKISFRTMVSTPMGTREAFKVSVQYPTAMTKTAVMASAKEHGISGKGVDVAKIDQLADDVKPMFKLEGVDASDLVATMAPSK